MEGARRGRDEDRSSPSLHLESSLVCSKARSSMSSLTHSSPALHRRSSSPTRAHHGHHLPSRLRTESSFDDPDQPFVESPQSSTTAGAGCAEDSPDPATDLHQHATAADPGTTGLHDVAEEQGDNWLPDPQVVERPAAERPSSLSPSSQSHRERVELTPSPPPPPPPPPPSLSSRSSRPRPRSLLPQSATRRRSLPPSGPPSPRPTSSRSTRTRTGRRARRASTRAGSTSPTSRAASSSRSPTMPHTAPSSPS